MEEEVVGDFATFPAVALGLPVQPSPIVFSTNKELVHACPNGINFLDVETKEGLMVRGEGNLVQSIAVNARIKVVAYSAGYVDKPAVIVVMDIESKTPSSYLRGKNLLSLKYLDFSNDGQYLVSLGDAPDYTISVWDWKNEKLLTEASCARICTVVQFCTSNHELLMCTGSDAVLMWRFDKIHNESFLHCEEITFNALMSECNCFCWIPGDVAAVGFSDGKIILLDGGTRSRLKSAETGEILPAITVSQSPITCIVPTLKHVVVGSADGTIRWILVSNGLCTATTPTVSGAITTISFTPMYGMMAFSTSSAHLYTAPISSSLILAPDIEATATIEFSLFARYHNGGIVEVGCFEGSPLIATAGKDNNIFLWDMRDFSIASQVSLVPPVKPQPTLRSKRALKTNVPVAIEEVSELRCMAVSTFGRLIAVGDSLGRISIIDFAILNKPRIVFREKLHDGAVTKVRWHPEHSLLVSTGTDLALVFTYAADDEVIVFGRKRLLSQILDVRWGVTGELIQEEGEEPMFNITHIIVSTADGKIHMIDSPALAYRPTLDMNISDEICPVRSIQLKSPWVQFLLALGNTDGTSMVMMAHLDSKKLYRYEILAENFDGSGLMEIQGIDSFSATGTGLAISLDAVYLACTDTTGLLYVFDALAIKSKSSLPTHNIISGGCTGVTFFEENLITIGNDGFIIVHSLLDAHPAISLDVPLAGTEDSIVPLIREYTKPLSFPPGAIPPNFIDTIIEEMKASAAGAPLSQESVDAAAEIGGGDGIHLKLALLRSKFQRALNSNKSASELERLPEEDFVIDLEMKEALIRDTNVRVLQVQQEVKMENMGKELIAHRIKHECIFAVDVPGITIQPLNAVGQDVPNYPIIKTSLFENYERDHGFLTTVRKAEMQSQSLSKIPLLSANIVLTDAQQKRCEERASERRRREKESVDESDQHPESSYPHTETMGEEETEEEEGGGVWHGDDFNPSYLLYPAFELTTLERKLLQMNFLRRKIRDMQKQFNGEVEAMLAAKGEEVGKIGEKLARMDEIDDELKLEKDQREVRSVPPKPPSETPGANLIVLDSEVKAERVMDDSERDELARQSALEQERARNADQSGVKKALDVMMGGSLEVPKQNEFELMERPDFMDDPDAILTDDQIKIAKEYEKRLKTYTEEKEKHRKVLEAESKKLKREIEDINDAFDERLRGLWEKKLLYESHVCAVESNVLILLEDINVEAALVAEIKRQSQLVDSLESKVNSAREEYDKMKIRVDTFREEYESVLVDDKQLEKKFRREFADHVEVYDALFKLFKKRKYPTKEEDTENTSLVTLDPFEIKINPDGEASAIEYPEPLDITNDIPDGLETEVWERLVEVRDEKIEVEIDIKRKALMLGSLNRRLHTLSQYENIAQSKYEIAAGKLDELRQEYSEMQIDLRLLVAVKQGQLEMNETGNFTTDDLVDAVLIDRQVVETYNKTIGQLGKEKVSILNETKDFKRKIHMLRWENEVLDAKSKNVEEDTRSYQLLRVTKNLQQMIKGGAKDKNAAEIATLEKQLEYIKDLHEIRVEEKKRKLFKVHRSVKEKELENEKLRDYVEDLSVSVAQRKKIIHVRESEAETGEDREFRMQELVWRRLVLEEARQQSEDIDILKSEVDRLRQRTFPSFAKNYEKNVALR